MKCSPYRGCTIETARDGYAAFRLGRKIATAATRVDIERAVDTVLGRRTRLRPSDPTRDGTEPVAPRWTTDIVAEEE